MVKVIFFLTTSFLSFQVLSQQYNLIPEKSRAEWTGYAEIGGFVQKGELAPKSGFIVLDNDTITGGKITFDLGKLTHEDKTLEKHLKDKDFFFVRKYPTAFFEIQGIEGNVVVGKLTIRGITKEVRFDFETLSKDNLIIAEGKAEIDRTKFNIKYNSSSYFQDLGNYAIKNEFDLVFRMVFKSEVKN